MQEKTLPSYEELAAAAEKRCGRAMRNSLIIAIVFVVVGVTAIWLITSWKLPFWALIALAILAPVSILVSIISFIDSGRFFELKSYEPRLWKNIGECEKLKQSVKTYADKIEEHYQSLWREHLALIMFIYSRSPALLAEFTAGNAESAEENEEEEGGSRPPPDDGEKN